MNKDKPHPAFEEIKKATQERGTTRGSLRSIAIKLDDFLRYFDYKDDLLSTRQREELRFIRDVAKAHAELEEDQELR